MLHVFSGERLKGYDVKHAGVATHFVTSEKACANQLVANLISANYITAVDIMKIPLTGAMIY